MNLLIDTHSFLWFISGSEKISKTAIELIEDNNNHPWLSMASLWEMAIKVSIGRLKLAHPYKELILKQIVQNGIELLDIKVDHISEVAQLPFHHRDPFDRLLIAQAKVEIFPIISADESFDAYGVTRLW